MAITINPINPLAFEFGFLKIYWYGIAYFLGIIIGIFGIKKLDQKYHYFPSKETIDLFMTFIILGIILGGRIGYILFYNLSEYLNNPSEIIQVWHGGMSFHGALIGLTLSSYIFSRKYKINFFYLTDYICFLAPIGIFFGRLANFVNRELVGRESNFRFAIKFPDEDISRHASQLYEAFGEGLILFLIMIFMEKKYNILSKKSYTSSLFLVLYGITRFFLEFFRMPDEQIGFFFGFITEGQILCAIMIICGALINNLMKNKN